MSKRKRDHAFVLQEKVMLLELVERNLNVIENKHTDAKTNQYKIIMWQKIGEEFNAHSMIRNRGLDSLKKCWENMKRKAKEEQKTLKQSLDNLNPGEEPPKLDAINECVLELLKKPIQEHLDYDEIDQAIATYNSNESKQDETGVSNATTKIYTRENPFIEPEMLLLFDIVEKNLDIIENKRTDRTTSKRKISKWVEISEEFNGQTTIQIRHWQTLKRCWENLKYKAKAGKIENPVIYNRVMELMQRPISNSVDAEDDNDNGSNNSSESSDSEAETSQDTSKRVKTESCANVEDLVEVQIDLEVETSNDSMNYSVHDTPEREDASSPHVDPFFRVKEEPTTSPRLRLRQTSAVRCNDDKSESQNIGSKDKDITAVEVEVVSYAEEEHKQRIQILKLQLEKEKIILNNENLKTEVLNLQKKQELLKNEQEEIKLALLKKQLLD